MTGRRWLAHIPSAVVALALALAAATVIASCSSGRPSGKSFFASDPSATRATIVLTGNLNGALTVTSTPACLTKNGGIAPLRGALENDWKLSSAGKSVGILTWYVEGTADGTISLTNYAASITMTDGPHELNGMTGTVVQTNGAHDIRFDVSFQDANDSNFVVHASGDVTC